MGVIQTIVGGAATIALLYIIFAYLARGRIVAGVIGVALIAVITVMVLKPALAWSAVTGLVGALFAG
ncbi:hypothetical protein [Georgenia yuyongxinii]|uniref:Uncharacterized protein n=1 Tax=Georgenia yuyongxinii TaxID=2589797 RepID=A0A552WU63_9MICO|nr:hypothetical protein [Georgenia yuyongxinii]TRW46390.1 hypothetical protein FJ693_05540 [Georgenia yuyongxinii]